MPTTKSAEKRMRTNEEKRKRNSAFKSKIKTAERNLTEAIGESNKEQAVKLLNEVYSLYDKAVKKGFMKQNTAARYKSGHTARINAI